MRKMVHWVKFYESGRAFLVNVSKGVINAQPISGSTSLSLGPSLPSHKLGCGRGILPIPLGRKCSSPLSLFNFSTWSQAVTPLILAEICLLVPASQHRVPFIHVNHKYQEKETYSLVRGGVGCKGSTESIHG